MAYLITELLKLVLKIVFFGVALYTPVIIAKVVKNYKKAKGNQNGK